MREAKNSYEIKITKEILQDRNGKKKWEHINKLTGRKEKASKEEVIYDEEKRKLDQNDGKKRDK